MAKKLLTHNLMEPLDGVKTAKVDINTGTGNLTIDGLPSGVQVLASGTLQYLENQSSPDCSLEKSDGHATLALSAKGGIHTGFRFPWSACNGATDWQIHLNSNVKSEITACSGGGNVKLNLAGMAVTCVSADTGGGNVDVVLPDNSANLCVTAKSGGGNVSVEIGSGTTGSGTVLASSGAGNVMVTVPAGIAARIHPKTGLGKLILDSRFSNIDGATYQSPDYDTAADKVEITISSGAGNVSVITK